MEYDSNEKVVKKVKLIKKNNESATHFEKVDISLQEIINYILILKLLSNMLL